MYNRGNIGSIGFSTLTISSLKSPRPPIGPNITTIRREKYSRQGYDAARYRHLVLSTPRRKGSRVRATSTVDKLTVGPLVATSLITINIIGEGRALAQATFCVDTRKTATVLWRDLMPRRLASW